jgi:DNA-binding response OmpR family regulator
MSAIMPQAGLQMHSVPLMARVLIIEDDPFVRSAIAADLTQRAHAVRTVGTALDGIREVSQHSPEVIVLDLGLPDLDGQQALKMMRAVTTTPVIVATARHEEAEIIRLLNAGADDYLVKPFSCEHLAARISAQLRRAGQASAATVISASRGGSCSPRCGTSPTAMTRPSTCMCRGCGASSARRPPGRDTCTRCAASA